MTFDEALIIITSTSTVRVAGVDCIYDGLTLMKKYHSDTFYTMGDYQILCGVDFEESVAEMSEEDVRSMAKMGWFESEDSWSHFV